MGFNYGVVRRKGDGSFQYDFEAARAGESVKHGAGCERDTCMCSFGIDTSRHVGDRDFFGYLGNLPGTLIVDESDGWGGGTIYIRPNIQEARAQADFMDEDQNSEWASKRAHEVLDALEADESLWLYGG